MKHMLLCVGIALGVGLSATQSGHAFSIGEMKVQSYLHTPFVAEVALNVKPPERAQDFVAMIGDTRDYEAEGLTRMPVIETLRPSIILGPSDIIRIISTEPIDVSAFDLLLLVRTGQVTIVRNYPVTLTSDPRSDPIVAEVTPPGTMPQAIGDTPLAEAEWLANLPAQYGPIVRGEMLYKVMRRLRVPEPYLWQVAVRIWEYNQERFIRGNLHGLKIGVYLEIPENLRDSLAALSRHDAQEMVAVQWDSWQKPAHMVAASTMAHTERGDAASASAPAKPAPQPAEAMAFTPETDMASLVNRATLESVLQGFERRLEQRLLPPSPAADATDTSTITFVSADELQMAIQSLESRLLQRLETRQHPPGARRHEAAAQQPPLRVGMETALASFLTADSWVYVFIVQNGILLVIAAGIAWRWYRKRGAGA